MRWWDIVDTVWQHTKNGTEARTILENLKNKVTTIEDYPEIFNKLKEKEGK